MAPHLPTWRAGHSSLAVYSRKWSWQVHHCQPAQKHKHILFFLKIFSTVTIFGILLFFYDSGYFFIIVGVFQFLGSANNKL